MEDEIIITDSLTKYYGQIKGIEDVSVKVPYYLIVIISQSRLAMLDSSKDHGILRHRTKVKLNAYGPAPSLLLVCDLLIIRVHQVKLSGI